MEEYLNIRPDLFEMGLARHLHHAVQYREHPGGYTRDVGDILCHCFTGNTFTLYLKVAEQCSLLLGYSYQINQRIDVFYQNGTEVAHQ